jgi:hypothetical protein
MLAVGSGSVFTSAAFNNSVNPSSDMRVVVDDSELTLEPGILFRDGSSADAPFDPGASTPANSETLQDQDSDSLFGGNSDGGLENISPSDLPAAAINDAVDGDLFLEVAVALGVDDKIGDGSNGVFQVRNDTTDDQFIAIRFPNFGSDVGNGVSEQKAVDTFQFFDSDDTHISTTDPAPSTQQVNDYVTVGPGEVEQIHVDYNTNDPTDVLKDAVDTSGSGFNRRGTVDLVDTIDVGVEQNNDDVDNRT